MSIKNLGIIGGGQLGSLLAVAAKKLNINTTIYCDDNDAPAQNFCDEFIFGKYEDKNKILEFAHFKGTSLHKTLPTVIHVKMSYNLHPI